MSSTCNSSSCDDKVLSSVKKVLARYKKPQTQELYEELVKLTREKCEELLKDSKGKEIKGVVQGRVKKYDSLKKKLGDLEEDHVKEHDLKKGLKKKLTDLENDPKYNLTEYGTLKEKVKELEGEKDPNDTPNFRDWVSNEDIYEHPEMGDLAGVRIGLYFPDDVPKVAQMIEEHFDRTWRFGTVTGGRDAIQGRNVDIQEHMNGRWRSQGPDGTDEHWEHYGYKSWQVVVKPLAKHLKLLGEKMDEKGLNSLREKMDEKGLNSLRVEIQVGTVVTQAWAEVQHNIIYKRPADFLATPAMKRMIDAINGLAITTEIMLKELVQNVELVKKEAEAQGRQRFASADEFLQWFQSTYIDQMPAEEGQRWVLNKSSAEELLFIMRLADVQFSTKYTPCPTDFKELIEESRLLQPKTETARYLDISIILRDALPYPEFIMSHFQSLYSELEALYRRESQLRRESQRSFESPLVSDFHRWLCGC